MRKKIEEAIKSGKVRFKEGWCGGDYGEYEDGVVTINLATCILPTVIHELIHYLDPKMGHRRVNKLEWTLYRCIPIKERRRLTRIVLKKLLGRTNETQKARKRKQARKRT